MGFVTGLPSGSKPQTWAVQLKLSQPVSRWSKLRQTETGRTSRRLCVDIHAHLVVVTDFHHIWDADHLYSPPHLLIKEREGSFFSWQSSVELLCGERVQIRHLCLRISSADLRYNGFADEASHWPATCSVCREPSLCTDPRLVYPLTARSH